MFVLTVVELCLLFFGVAAIVLTVCPFMRSPGAIGRTLAVVVFVVLAIAQLRSHGWPKSIPPQRVADQARSTTERQTAEEEALCVFEAVKAANVKRQE
jgi:hypothetical protein